MCNIIVIVKLFSTKNRNLCIEYRTCDSFVYNMEINKLYLNFSLGYECSSYVDFSQAQCSLIMRTNRVSPGLWPLLHDSRVVQARKFPGTS